MRSNFYLLTFIAVFSWFVQPNSAEAGCRDWLPKLFGRSAAVRSISEANREIISEAEIGGKLDVRTLHTLFQTDGLSLEDSLAASQRIKDGSVDLNSYRAMRKAGVSHDHAIRDASKNRFFAAAARLIPDTSKARELSNAIESAIPELARTFFRTRMGRYDTRDVLFDNIISFYLAAANQGAIHETAVVAAAEAAKRFFEDATSFKLPLIVRLFNGKPDFSRPKITSYYIEARRANIGHSEAMKLALDRTKNSIQQLVEVDKIPFIEAAAAIKAGREGQIDLATYRLQRKSGNTHDISLALASQNRFFAQAVESGISLTEAQGLVGRVGDVQEVRALFRSGVRPNKARDTLFGKIISAYKKVKRDNATPVQAMNVAALAAEQFVKISRGTHFPIIGTILRTSRERSLNAILDIYSSARKEDLSHAEALELMVKPPKSLPRYLQARQHHQIGAEEAFEMSALSKKKFELTLEVRSSGASPEETSFVLKNAKHPLSYAKGRRYGLSHIESLALAALSDTTQYFTAREAGTDHEKALVQAIGIENERIYDRAMAIANTTPLQALDVANKVEDSEAYFAARDLGDDHADSVLVGNADVSLKVYKRARLANIPPKESREVAALDDADGYFTAKGAGATHAQSIEVEKLEVANEYATARGMNLDHADSLEAAKVPEFDDYVAVHEAGASHRETMAAIDSGEDLESYAIARKAGANHLEAMYVSGQSIDAEDYARARKLGLNHPEALNIANLENVESYFDARSANGVTHAEATYVANHVDDVEGYILARNAGATHDEAVYVAEYVRDTSEYGVQRRQGRNHAETLIILKE